MAQSELLVSRLVEKGIALDYIPQVVGSVVWVARNGEMSNNKVVNEKLEEMGWGREVLDEGGFELIVRMLENVPTMGLKTMRSAKPS